MSDQANNKRGMPGGLLWGFPIILALAVIAALVINWAEASKMKIPVMGEVPAFEVTERGGEMVNRSNLMGHINVISFIFTNCPGACPLMMKAEKPLYDLYHNSDKVQFLSISVDPESDSLAALRAYAKNNGITDNRWLFCRAPMEDVKKLIRDGFMMDASSLPGGHPVHFILVDDKARIRGYYPYDEDGAMYLLKQHIRELARQL